MPSLLLVTLNRLDEQVMRLLNRDRMAEYLRQQYHFPQVYRNQLFSDLRKVEPKAIRHFFLFTGSIVPLFIAIVVVPLLYRGVDVYLDKSEASVR